MIKLIFQRWSFKNWLHKSKDTNYALNIWMNITHLIHKQQVVSERCLCTHSIAMVPNRELTTAKRKNAKSKSMTYKPDTVEEKHTKPKLYS